MSHVVLMFSCLTPSILISSIRGDSSSKHLRRRRCNEKHQIRISPLCCVRLRPLELARSQWLSPSTHWQHIQSISASVGKCRRTKCGKCAQQQYDAESTATKSQCSIAPELLLTAKSTRIISSVAASATRNKFSQCDGTSNTIQSTHSTASIPPSESNGSATRGRSRLLVDLRDSTANNYELNDNIRDCLVLHYKVNSATMYIYTPGAKVLEADRLDDYTLMVRNLSGNERTVDIICDSDFRESVMSNVGKAICEAYDWVPQTIPIYLYMDNVGGHGRKDVVIAYVATLTNDFNVIICHQRPRSPATNILDLGVWMALQNVVEKLHFRQRTEVEALCSRTVDDTWKELESIKLENVYGR